MKLTTAQVKVIAAKAYDMHWRDDMPDKRTFLKLVRMVEREILKNATGHGKA